MFVSVVCCHEENVTASVHHKTQQQADLGTAEAHFIHSFIFVYYTQLASLRINKFFFSRRETKRLFYFMNPSSGAAPVCVSFCQVLVSPIKSHHES